MGIRPKEKKKPRTKVRGLRVERRVKDNAPYPA